MNRSNQHRIQLLILFIATLVAILLHSASFWNQGLKNDITFSVWPLVLLVIAMVCSGFLFAFAHKITNPKILEKQVKDQVEREKIRLRAEFESKDEEVINKVENLEEKLKAIIPQGKFKTPQAFAEKLLFKLADELQCSIGVVYMAKGKQFKYLTGFALTEDEEPQDFKLGENLSGQAAKTKEILLIKDIPDDYFKIESGLGKSKPKTLIIVPIIHKNTSIGIIEIATFIKEDAEQWTALLQKVGHIAGEKINQIQQTK